MSKQRKSPSANQNWVRDEIKNDYHNQAIRKLAEVKAEEAKHHFKAIKADSRTTYLKRID